MVDDLARRRKTYGIDNSSTMQGENSRLHELSTSAANREHVVGFEDDLQLLEKKLLDSEPSRRVVSILGMGGLGKTTLARKLYNMNKHKFQSHAWICVSHKWEGKDLLKKIIKSLKNVNKENLEMLESMEYSAMVECLRGLWESSRYLLVIDDMWSRNVWQSLVNVLPENENGSRIVVTTHFKSVAQLSRRTYVHELRFLGLNESWELFCRDAFPEQSGLCPQHFQSVGQEMVRKCGGLPLAIIGLVELLSMKEYVDEWHVVKKRIWRELKKECITVSPLLELRWRDHRPDLHYCFLYLSLFPEDYEMDAVKLIQLWVAEDFIPNDEQGIDLEDLAENCLKELSDRCLIQVMEMKIRTILTCRVHELWRNQAIDSAKDKNFLHVHSEAMDSNLPTKASSAKRIVIHSRDEAYTLLDHSNKKVRTLAFLNNISEDDSLLDGNCTTKLISSICTRCKSLRVLELKGAGIGIKEAKLWLPEVCETLIYLKYLGLEDTCIDELPKSISKLQLLQTLVVDNSSKDKPPTILPTEICKLKQLRHLIGNFTVGRDKAPNLFGEFSNLKSLRSAGILEWDARKGDAAFMAFGRLRNLKTLAVRYSSVDNLCIEPLFNCRNLTDLEICGNIQSLPREMSERLQHLKYLSLEKSGMKKDPMPTLELLPNLLILRIAAFNWNMMKVTATGFPQLEELEFSLSRGPTTLREEEGAMPKLKRIGQDSMKRYCFPERFKTLQLKEVLTRTSLTQGTSL